MIVTFRLRYHTFPGEELFLVGEHPLLGKEHSESAVSLKYRDDEHWETVITIPAELPSEPLSYRYVVRYPDGTSAEDLSQGRRLDLSRITSDRVLVLDSWNSPGFVENTFCTEPFQEVLLPKHTGSTGADRAATPTHVFRVRAPLLDAGQTLCLLGGDPKLANWDVAQPVRLTRDPASGAFEATLDLFQAGFPLEYKFGVVAGEKGAFVQWEEGANRILPRPAMGELAIVNDGFARLPLQPWRAAGVSIPVFSLRSRDSSGVGEFLDLKHLADWGKSVRLKLIQILPVNDTSATKTWTDSYPYAAISAFALHPQYLNLQELAGKEYAELLERMQPERDRLNRLDVVDYEAMMALKLPFIRAVYAAVGQSTLKSAQFRQFFAANESWLVPYAAFCYLRDKHGTADYSQWPSHRRFDRETVDALLRQDPAVRDAMDLVLFTQFHLHQQLRDAVDYLHTRGIILKGDIPIGVYRHGADTWEAPELYHLEMQAGAPPDAFAAKGQNWGFPTYNWPRMQQDGFAWWKCRFAQMSNYFDAFRIDHILGFFRIWSIPLDAIEGILGYFVPALPVRAAEFSARGIPFDHNRYTRPWITDDLLQELFGPEAQRVSGQFLEADRPGFYALKTEFSTQRKVDTCFKALPQTPANDRLREGLFDLISNVILLEPEGGGQGEFHFRLGMSSTHSFKALDQDTRSKLEALYVDYFYRRQDDFWMRQALGKLPALQRVTNMLICGEDLGMVPACVPHTMKRLGLLSLEIQRMPKDLGQKFSRPANAPYLSVVTPSTHDMSTIRGWWQEDRAVTQEFWNLELGHTGQAPATCEPWINEEIVVQHLKSPAMWSIFQLQDLLGIDSRLRRADVDAERINVPATSKHYWRYRMHLDLEALQEDHQFNSRIRDLLAASGR